MSAFSRGINLFALPAPSRVALLQSRLHLLHTTKRAQNFCTTFRLSATSKPPATKPKYKIVPPRNGTANGNIVQVGTKPLPNSTLGTRTQALPTGSFVSKNIKASLLQAGKPTVIYEAGTGKTFVGGCVFLATACALYAGYIFEGYWNPRPEEDVPAWVKYVFLITSVLFTGISIWIYTATVPRILRISTIPVKNLQNFGRSGLNLRIQGVRYLPFYRQTVEFPLENVTTSHKLQYMPIVESQGPMLELGEMPLLIRPFAAFGRWFGRLIREVRGGITREHFVYVYVKGGYSWKLDVRGRALGGSKGKLYSCLRIRLCLG
jgi:hypothetical protein